MSYRTILVNLDLDGPIEPITKAAVILARRFQARLIGFCAATAPMPLAGPEAGALAVQSWVQMREETQASQNALRDRFDGLVAGQVETEWRDAFDSPTRALAQASRASDLVVMSASDGAATGDAYRRADPGSVALQAGRPLLVVAHGAEQVAFESVVVAWKDTREARRAVADALPLLKSADKVIVVTVATKADQQIQDGIADVVAFLAGHGVDARSEVLQGSEDGSRLVEFIATHRADLVVSGAYGHSRLREWAFGGVTRSLLDETGLNRFMSS